VTASVGLAFLAALLFAVSAALQQYAARSAAVRTDAAPGWLPILGVVRALLRDRWWLGGMVANVAGCAVHAVALRLGSLAMVQTILVMQLLFAVPLARLRGRSPLVRDWCGTAAVCAGLAVLFIVRGVATQPIGVRHDVPGAVGSAAVSSLLVQDAFAAGSLSTSLTALVLTDPAASWIVGMVVFDAGPPTGGSTIAWCVAGAVLIAAGVALLAVLRRRAMNGRTTGGPSGR
jgi:hypothetical protein